VSKDIKGTKEDKVFKAYKDHRDGKVKVFKGCKAMWAFKDTKEPKEIKGDKVIKAFKECKDIKARAYKGSKELTQGRKEIKVVKDGKVEVDYLRLKLGRQLQLYNLTISTL
jgi:hypothetical protein